MFETTHALSAPGWRHLLPCELRVGKEPAVASGLDVAAHDQEPPTALFATASAAAANGLKPRRAFGPRKCVQHEGRYTAPHGRGVALNRGGTCVTSLPKASADPLSRRRATPADRACDPAGQRSGSRRRPPMYKPVSTKAEPCTGDTRRATV